MLLNRFKTRSIIVISLFLYLLITTNCSQKKKIKGPEIIPQEVFVQVITDIYLMDGVTNDMKYYRKYNPHDSIDIYSSIFDKYGVSSKMYKNTIEEYSKYPKLFDDVYDDVLKQLNSLQDQVESEIETEKQKAAQKRNEDRKLQ